MLAATCRNYPSSDLLNERERGMHETPNARIVRQLLSSLNERDTARWAEWLREDCYQTLPFAPRGDFPTRIETASEIIFHFDHVLAKRAGAAVAKPPKMSETLSRWTRPKAQGPS